MEENVLALLDDSSDSKHTPDANDDRFAQVANEGNLQALEMEHLGDLNSLSSCCRNHELDLSKGVLAPSEHNHFSSHRYLSLPQLYIHPFDHHRNRSTLLSLANILHPHKSQTPTEPPCPHTSS
ncbi:hypothetical protein D5086_008119 [Populus alba]|uniref:Uncharacterized protein n=1 Tax=Populus alba TaxID=43335 RepID=A0ACC4CFV9_POPAL